MDTPAVNKNGPRKAGHSTRLPQLDCRFASLAGTNADNLLDSCNEDLTVTDLAGMCCLENGINGILNGIIGDNDFNLHLGQEIDDILCTAIQLGMPFLAAKTFNFSDGKALNANLGQRLTHLVELERFDHGFDFFHGSDSGELPKC